jgi:hypothetical protein
MQREAHVNRNNPKKAHGRDDQEAVERRASVSMETPANVTRSTQDLTVGGNQKDPDSHREASTEDLHSAPAEKNTPQQLEPSGEPDEALSSSEQAVLRQERAPESGEGSPR